MDQESGEVVVKNNRDVLCYFITKHSWRGKYDAMQLQSNLYCSSVYIVMNKDYVLFFGEGTSGCFLWAQQLSQPTIQAPWKSLIRCLSCLLACAVNMDVVYPLINLCG